MLTGTATNNHEHAFANHNPDRILKSDFTNPFGIVKS